MNNWYVANITCLVFDSYLQFNIFLFYLKMQIECFILKLPQKQGAVWMVAMCFLNQFSGMELQVWSSWDFTTRMQQLHRCTSCQTRYGFELQSWRLLISSGFFFFFFWHGNFHLIQSLSFGFQWIISGFGWGCQNILLQKVTTQIGM